MSNDVPLRVKAQRFGRKLSVMVLLNLGAFMGWGILTALGIWLPNDILKAFISSVLTCLLSLLITIFGGKMMCEEKGAIIDALTTMGVIIGADISVLLETMVIAPLPAWLSKKLDAAVEPLTPVGFELLIGNLTVALLGAVIAIIGYVWIALAITSLSAVLSIGVSTLENDNLLPLTVIFIEPMKVLFLNNATGQEVLTPFGMTRLNELGKSILSLPGSSPGPGLGILLTCCFFGKGGAKVNVYGVSIIHLFGGVHEIYFPLILMNPLTVLAAITGGIAGTFLFIPFSVDLVGVSSPGSIVTITMMTPAGDQLLILFIILASTAVSFLVVAVIAKRSRQDGEDVNKDLKETAKRMESLKGKKPWISSAFEEKEAVTDFRMVKHIVHVCDAGIGSSAMGASVIAKRLRKAGTTDITMEHIRVMELPDPEADIIVTHVPLRQVVHEKQPDIETISIGDHLNAPKCDKFVSNIRIARS